ncbi:MAG TPA: hypothetical protein VNX88_19700 [Terriglobales bacterium]|nr:hypothetical protein [Terriglobales bacterium]
MFDGHLNTEFDDYPVTIGVGVLEAEADDENQPVAVKDAAPEPLKQRKARLQQGWVSYNRFFDSWAYQWKENGRTHSKTLGHSDTLTDKDAAWHAAEPLRLAFLKRQQENPVEAAEPLDDATLIERDIERAVREESTAEVEALLRKDERSNRSLYQTGKHIFDAYVYQKVNSDMRGSLRAFKYQEETASRGCNRQFVQASKSDFIADCELTFRRSLTPHERALIQLVFLDFKATEEEVERLWPGQLFAIFCRLGAKFRRKGMASLATYFSIFDVLR